MIKNVTKTVITYYSLYTVILCTYYSQFSSIVSLIQFNFLFHFAVIYYFILHFQKNLFNKIEIAEKRYYQASLSTFLSTNTIVVLVRLTYE